MIMRTNLIQRPQKPTKEYIQVNIGEWIWNIKLIIEDQLTKSLMCYLTALCGVIWKRDKRSICEPFAPNHMTKALHTLIM